VISVGNLEVGGGGKTPCVLALASYLSGRGLRPAVVTRGYGGEASGEIATPVLLAEIGDSRAARRFGDEAVLYLRAGLPVAVFRERERGIAALSESAGPTHIILDDAFHRTSITKDLDILLLDHERPFGGGRLLPYGTLREPPRAAGRADAVIFTRASGRGVPPEAERFVSGRPVFFAEHRPAALLGSDGAETAPSSLSGRRVALLSGIARPGSFERTAAEAGLDPDISFRFDDHHRYSGSDIMDMMEECPGCVFVTTEKDWVKVSELFPPEAELLRLSLAMEIEGIEDLLRPVL
jgi:tetraacyldisaccharide 4'-kinase